MSWRDRLRRYLPFVRRPTYDSNYHKFMGYYGWLFANANKSLGQYNLYEQAERNVYVYRSIEIISDTLLINGFKINNPDEEDNNYERVKYLTDLFNNPMGYESQLTYAMFHKQYMKSFELTGDAFIEVNYEEFPWDDSDYYKVINGFQFIPPEMLKWYEDTEQWGYRTKPSIRYENDEIIHIYEPDITLKNGHYGISKLEKIRQPIIMMWLGMGHNQELLENDGIDPRAILSFDKDITDESFENQLDRLEEYAQERKKGGTLAVKGASFQSSGMSNNDMDFLSLMNMCRDMILTAYGVQPGKAGIRETGNIGTGTGESQDKDFKDMMSAKSKIIEGAFNKVLGHNGFDEVFSFNEVDIEDKLKRSQIETNKLNAGILTVNEVRQDYGLEPVAWGDIPNGLQKNLVLNDMNKLPLDSDNTMKRFKNNIVKSGYLTEWSNVDDW